MAGPLSIIATVFSLLASPFGMMAILVGVVLFIMGPFVPRITNRYYFLARLHIWVGAQLLKRIAVVITEHGDLLMKRMSPTGIGTEQIKFNDSTKEFKDQLQARTHWMGVPFALADEVHGFFFNPAHAALGSREKSLRDNNIDIVKATESERDMYEIGGWYNAIYEFATNAYELVGLSDVRYLISGVERSEHPQRIESFYELSREPYQDTSTLKRLARIVAILLAMLGPFAVIWILAAQMGAETARDSVSFGVLSAFATLGIDKATVKSIAKKLAPAFLVFGWLPVVFILSSIIVGPITTIALYILIGAGFWFIPILGFLFRVSTKASNALGPLLIKLGLGGYEDPVFEYTASGYRMRAYRQLETTNDVNWHTLFGRRVGFTFTPGSDIWATEEAAVSDIEGQSVDTGTTTRLPNKKKVIPERTRAGGMYAAMVPNALSTEKFYVWSGIALSRFADIATGEKSTDRLLAAKEEHGSATPDTRMGYVYMLGMMAFVSFAFGVWVFVL